MTTNQTIEQIHRHTSVRSYKPDPLPATLVERIVAAGQRSSTSSNLQMYSVVAVLDSDRRAKMAELCGNQSFIAQAPVFLAWCADLSRLDRICKDKGYTQVSGYVENFLLAAVDVSIAMQTAALAAESLGLGMCYVGAIRNRPQEVIKLLALPNLVFPISGMTVGWPAQETATRPRLPKEAILHWETYDVTDEEAALVAYDAAMIATGIYQGRQVDTTGRFDQIPDQMYGWTEHSARRVASRRRQGLREALAAQGFELR